MNKNASVTRRVPNISKYNIFKSNFNINLQFKHLFFNIKALNAEVIMLYGMLWYGMTNENSMILYTGKILPPFYFCTFCPSFQRANLILGTLLCLILSLFKHNEQVHLSYRELALFQCQFYVENINKLRFSSNI